MHPWAKTAAELASCAALQSDKAFWDVHDFLFANQASLNSHNISERVESHVASRTQLLNAKQFSECMDRRLSAGMVELDHDLAIQNGVRATPTIFINGVRHEGVKDVEQLRFFIKALGEPDVATNNN